MAYQYAEGLDSYFDRLEDEFTREDDEEEIDPAVESQDLTYEALGFFTEPEDPIALEAVDLEAWEIQHVPR